MPRKRTLRLRCPICKKFVPVAGPDFPFCSERCRLVDLGNWASGQYVIPASLADADNVIAAIPGSLDDTEDQS